jgi:hypothetical protein
MTLPRKSVFPDLEGPRRRHYQKDLPIIVLTILFGALSMARPGANPNIGIMT